MDDRNSTRHTFQRFDVELVYRCFPDKLFDEPVENAAGMKAFVVASLDLSIADLEGHDDLVLETELRCYAVGLDDVCDDSVVGSLVDLRFARFFAYYYARANHLLPLF